ncbi:MAG: hypothetical protein GY847_16710, partial [Proteobacteria bacterium]|nr:hypothetical protein [Pseudomonadota bacterium]
RIDRICTFLKELDQRIDAVEQIRIKDNEYFRDLFEDCLLISSRALSEKRNRYIAIFLSKSKNVDVNVHSVKKKMLYILQELTDKDIEILQSIKEEGFSKTEGINSAKSVNVAHYQELNPEEKYV